MSKTDNGGPAFPVTEANGANCGDMGITVRDYFAIETLNGGLTQDDFANRLTFEERASWCYAQADAMLRERAK